MSKKFIFYQSKFKLLNKKTISYPDKIEMDIYMIKIKSIETNNEYYLYYTSYLKDIDTEIKEIKQILYIKLKESKLTKFGLDEFYVSAGFLIYKYYDYAQQLLSISYLEHTSQYRFIGDIFDASSILP